MIKDVLTIQSTCITYRRIQSITWALQRASSLGTLYKLGSPRWTQWRIGDIDLYQQHLFITCPGSCILNLNKNNLSYRINYSLLSTSPERFQFKVWLFFVRITTLVSNISEVWVKPDAEDGLWHGMCRLNCTCYWIHEHYQIFMITNPTYCFYLFL
jgi:hypothetical protein